MYQMLRAKLFLKQLHFSAFQCRHVEAVHSLNDCVANTKCKCKLKNVKVTCSSICVYTQKVSPGSKRLTKILRWIAMKPSDAGSKGSGDGAPSRSKCLYFLPQKSKI